MGVFSMEVKVTTLEILDLVGRLIICFMIVSGMLIFITCNVNYVEKNDEKNDEESDQKDN